MGLIKNLIGRLSLNKLFFSKKELDALRSKSHEQEQIILIQDVVATINKLDPLKKQLFSSILHEPLYTPKTEVKSLLESGLIQICTNKTLLLNHYKKDELFSLLPDNLDIKIPKNITKSNLIETINTSIPSVISDLEKLYVVVELHDNIRHLHADLSRLF